VKLDLPAAAAELGTVATRALATAGGVDLARRAEHDPAIRASVVQPILADLGLADLDPHAGRESLAAAAELCRVAGYFAVPYPVAGALLGDRSAGVPFAVVSTTLPRIHHGDLFPRWTAASLDQRAWCTHRIDALPDSPLEPFVAAARLVPAPGPAPLEQICPALILSAWQVLGTLEHALQLTVEHVRERHQFGQPLAKFQAVQFQVADAAVAVDGLRQLAQYTISGDVQSRQLSDALALRVHAIESANLVIRICHQLHGAIGFCDEHDLSFLSRHVRPLLRLPLPLEASVEALVTVMEERGFDSLFSPRHPVTPQRA
jgi:alkylation response protein AidB-like acyl-CoA dehydrogenase